jgi:hypothetical protein
MKDLKLGMPILASTSLMLDNEILKLHPTTLVDAFETSHQKELQIKLGKGHWGCLPTRNRSQVCINSKEVGEFANNRLAEKFEEYANEDKKRIFIVNLNNNHSLTISTLTFSRTVNSLSEGSYSEYVGHYASMRIGSRLPSNVFYSLNDAIDKFVETSKLIVK